MSNYNFKNQLRELVPSNEWKKYYNDGWRSGKSFIKNGILYKYFYKDKRKYKVSDFW